MKQLRSLTQELTVHRTIEQLAQEVGLSPTALKSCFKGIYGSSVYAYQKEYRLQLAQKLLLETDCTVAEIAIGSGTKIRISFLLHFGKQPA